VEYGYGVAWSPDSHWQRPVTVMGSSISGLFG